MAKVTHNAGDYESRAGFELLAKGRYLAMVSSSIEKETKRKDGTYFEFEFVVLRPETAKNRKLWSRMNINNPSEEATRIGREQFNALCEACGFEKGKVDDTVKLHDKVLTLIVDIEPGVGGNRDQNRVTGYLTFDQANTDAVKKAVKDAKSNASSAGTGSRSTRPAQPAGKGPGKPGGVDDMDDDIPF